jgi:hypothetical protein
VTTDLLFSAVITPGGALSAAISGQNITWHPPVGYFGRLFQYWRGSMIYKFKFIKSKYHKGRLVISWDPANDITAITDADTAVFSKIVDLEVDDEIEIEIPYKATTPYLLTRHNTNAWSNGGAPTLGYNKKYDNGILTIRVQNVLTGPAVLPQIDILTFIRPGKDFMYSAPKDLINTVSPLPLQSGEQSDIAAQSPQIDKAIGLITTGENIASLRPLLHRTSFYCTQHLGSYLTGSGTYQGQGLVNSVNIFPKIPDSYGWLASSANWAVTSTLTNQPFNFVAVHPIDWTVNCFAGYRGSTTMHFNPITSGANVSVVDSLSASRYYESNVLNPTLQGRNRFALRTNNGSASSISRVSVSKTGSVSRKPLGQSGMSLTNVRTQAALSVNIPQYSHYRFQPAFITGRNTVSKAVLQDNVALSATFDTALAGGATVQWPMVDVYYSAGVDFNPVFFVCIPRTYEIGTPNPVDSYAP